MEIRRDIYLDKLISKKHNGLIKVVTGMRRCGKSYLLFNLFKDHLRSEGIVESHIIEMAFDSFENKKYRDPEVLYPYLMERIADDEIYYVLLDAQPDKEKMNQEQRPMMNTGDSFKKIIITKDAVAPLYNDEGVLIMSVYDFLLDPNSMDN